MSTISQQQSSTSSVPSLPTHDSIQPLVCLVIGMAGSGKTTLMRQLISYKQLLHNKDNDNRTGYSINLDPAVHALGYTPNIDIRDTVNYKQVMKQYNLGPNGGILTSLNLFATRFDQVLNILEKRRNNLSHIFVDTPGQIEVFTWSASGMIITDSIAQSIPTCILYCVDTPRNLQPTTFMSNMLYACSIMYKTNLPLLCVFNKNDVNDSAIIEEWINDSDKFMDALNNDDTYMSSLTRSMSLMLNEFYQTIQHVSVSAVTGNGFDTLFDKLNTLKQQYYDDYIPMVKDKIQAKQQEEKNRQEISVQKLQRDMNETNEPNIVLQGPRHNNNNDINSITDIHSDEDDVYEGEDDYDNIQQRNDDQREYEEFMKQLSITEQLQKKKEQRQQKLSNNQNNNNHTKNNKT